MGNQPCRAFIFSSFFSAWWGGGGRHALAEPGIELVIFMPWLLKVAVATGQTPPGTVPKAEGRGTAHHPHQAGMGPTGCDTPLGGSEETVRSLSAGGAHAWWQSARRVCSCGWPERGVAAGLTEASRGWRRRGCRSAPGSREAGLSARCPGRVPAGRAGDGGRGACRARALHGVVVLT